MTRRQIALLGGLCPIVLLGGLACSGSSSDSSNVEQIPASLQSQQDAARAAAALQGVVEGLTAADELIASTTAASARPANQLKIAGNQQEDCDIGGSMSSSVAGTTATIVFDQCQNQHIQESRTINTLLDGTVRFRCTALSGNGCSAGNLDLNAGNDRLLVDLQINDNGSDTQDLLALVNGDADLATSETATGNRIDITSRLGLNLTDRLENARVVALTDDLRVVRESNDNNDTATISVDGRYGVTQASGADCPDGFIAVTTLSTLQVDSNDNLVAGELRLDNDSGETANVRYNADGSITVTQNGQSQNFSRAELGSFCGLGD